MPAPTPIQIRYGGDPAALGGLAFSAGTARRQNADYQSQLANDQAFLRNEISRRTEDTRFRNNFNLSLLGMQANERAARAQASALQEASGYNARQAAQAGGVANAGARGSGQQIDLVPAEGPLDGLRPGGGGSVTFYDRDDPDGPTEQFFLGDGRITHKMGGGLLPGEGGFVRPGPQQRMIPADRRSALEEIKLAQSWMEPAKWNALWTATQGGALDPSDVSKTINSIRTGGGGGGGRTPGENVARAGETSAALMWTIEQIPDEGGRRAEMARYLGAKPGSSESRHLLLSESGRLEQAWSAAKAGVAAKQRAGEYRDLPNAASAGVLLGSSMDKPVQVTHTWEADKLESGTFFQVPGGEIYQVP